MFRCFFFFLAATLSFAGVSGAFAKEVTVESRDEWVTIANGKNTLSFNLGNGLFYILDAQGKKVVDYAYFQLGGLQSKEKQGVRSFKTEDVNDSLGKGKCLTVRVAFENYSDILWQVSMYDDSPFVVFNMGVDNDTDRDYRLQVFHPLVSKNVYQGENNEENYKILDGLGGGGKTLVRSNNYFLSFNNIMVRFGKPESPFILTAGGLTYHEFEKFASVMKNKNSLNIDLMAQDPIGKGVLPGKTYLPDEKFYLCINNENPFVALERYGEALKKAQNIKVNYYDFPTECLWYASFYNRKKDERKFNDSKGAVNEMQKAISCGMTKYSRVGIRLVPDAYGPDNQQGWWDDEHWAKYGEGMSSEGPHYSEPYLTSKSWAGEIIRLGGVPITYFQGARRSEDYAQKYPGHMLFNDSYRVINEPERFKAHVQLSQEYGEGGIGGYYNHWWSDKMLWSYDFTDPDFLAHMRDVYKNLKEAGIAGIMYDYPEVTAWAFEGGFEDKTATTAYAYRQVFKMAYEGLGTQSYLDERNLLRGSDLTLGLVASQRVWADTDQINPEMVTRCGLRWYKNRVVVNYDMDAKDPVDAAPLENREGFRSMMTMCYVTSGRFLMGRSFDQLTPEQLYDFSRTFPYHTTPQSARPLDAFTSDSPYCKVYDFAVNKDWHQLTFYNTDPGKKDTVSVSLGASLNEGGMELEKDASYYAYDFWNDDYIGLLSGKEALSQELRPGEARMMSLRKKQDVPQYLSTSRHIMQGYLDMKECAWDASGNSLKGVSQVVEKEPYVIVIAINGKKPQSATVSQGEIAIENIENHPEIIKVRISPAKSGETRWTVIFR